MNEEQNNESTVPVTFNQLVEKRRLDAFRNSYEELKVFATENGYEKPKLGKFASDVIGAGLASLQPEDYYKKNRA